MGRVYGGRGPTSGSEQGSTKLDKAGKTGCAGSRVVAESDSVRLGASGMKRETLKIRRGSGETEGL